MKPHSDFHLYRSVSDKSRHWILFIDHGNLPSSELSKTLQEKVPGLLSSIIPYYGIYTSPEVSYVHFYFATGITQRNANLVLSQLCQEDPIAVRKAYGCLRYLRRAYCSEPTHFGVSPKVVGAPATDGVTYANYFVATKLE